MKLATDDWGHAKRLNWRTGWVDWPYHLARWGMGLVFIYAGAIKLLNPLSFAVLIDAYGMLPDILIMPVAIALPGLEVLAGIGLLLDIHKSLFLMAGLLLLFVAILGYGIWMGLDVDCGCFGPEDPEAEAFHGLRLSLYRDLIMLAAVGFMYAWRRHRDIRPEKISVVIENLLHKKETR